MLVEKTREVMRAKLFCAPNLNLEKVIVVQLEDWLIAELERHGIRLGEKNLVQNIEDSVAVPGRPQEFKVTLQDGYTFTLQDTGGQPMMAAGSSVNVAFAVKTLSSIVRPISVIGPIGPGSGGSSLSRALEFMGIERALFAGEGTSFTLNVVEEGRATQLCFKKRYDPDLIEDELVIEEISSDAVLMLTSIKESDLALARMFLGSRARVKGIVPHPELLKNKLSRDEFKFLLRENEDIFLQMNCEEAGLLLGGTFSPQRVEEMLELGPQMVIVTMGAQGAVCQERGESLITIPMYDAGKALDRCGAGDAFAAALIYARWLREGEPLSLEACLRFAAFVAGHVVTAIGPWTGLPSREKAEAYLTSLKAETRGELL